MGIFNKWCDCPVSFQLHFSQWLILLELVHCMFVVNALIDREFAFRMLCIVKLGTVDFIFSQWLWFSWNNWGLCTLVWTWFLTQNLCVVMPRGSFQSCIAFAIALSHLYFYYTFGKLLEDALWLPQLSDLRVGLWMLFGGKESHLSLWRERSYLYLDITVWQEQRNGILQSFSAVAQSAIQYSSLSEEAGTHFVRFWTLRRVLVMESHGQKIVRSKIFHLSPMILLYFFGNFPKR